MKREQKRHAKEQALAAIAAGEHPEEVAPRFGFKTATLCVYAYTSGVKITHRARQCKADAVKHEDIVARYKTGATLQSIGDIYGVSRERVRQIVNRHGVLREGGKYLRGVAPKPTNTRTRAEYIAQMRERAMQRGGLRARRDYCCAQVAAAIKSGVLAHPTKLTCVDCNKSAEQYEHRNYLFPLLVEPTCRACNLNRGPAIPMKGALAEAVNKGGAPYSLRLRVEQLAKRMSIDFDFSKFPRKLTNEHWRQFLGVFVKAELHPDDFWRIWPDLAHLAPTPRGSLGEEVAA